MIGIFFGLNDCPIAFFAAANDLVRHFEYFEIDRLYSGRFEAALLLKLQKRFDGRLRMDFGVVFFDDRSGHTFKVLVLPVDLERAGDGILESLVAFEYLERAGDASLGEKCRIYAASRSIRVSKPLPVRQGAGSRDTQRVEGCAADRNGVGRFHPVEAEGARYASCDCIGALRRMIEALGPHGCDIAQPTL